MTCPSSATAGKAAAEEKAAALSGAVCYVIWGLLPLLFMAAGRAGASPWELLAERCFWSVFWALGLVWLSGQGRQTLAVLKTPRTVLWLTASAVTIAGNWSIFIWAVNHGRTLESSLGYYLNPLMNVAVGAAVFRERLSRIGWIAVGLAAAGVVLQTAALGHPPLISLGLAGSFLIYGVIRKRVAADAQAGLFVECLILALPGLAYMVWLHSRGAGHLGASPAATVLLLVSGPATVIPLAAFSWAARRMPLSTLAFIQFIGPTIQFAVGLATGETLSALRGLSFLFIWSGVAVFLWGAWRAGRSGVTQRKPEPSPSRGKGGHNAA